jgi:hypothetical protein
VAASPARNQGVTIAELGINLVAICGCFEGVWHCVLALSVPHDLESICKARSRREASALFFSLISSSRFRSSLSSGKTLISVTDVPEISLGHALFMSSISGSRKKKAVQKHPPPTPSLYGPYKYAPLPGMITQVFWDSSLGQIQ